MKSLRDKWNKQISLEEGVDQRVVNLVSGYPLLFSRKRMADDNDTRPIRIRYFATFVPKTKYTKAIEERALLESH